ncbi:unnamed protein product [Linum trigynum]|uniref:CCHC-type domain-containing protein n=1 Tax=Linum trigynum TaxID=586398 RepID=A0AAV2GCQ7_9ROSI
MEMLMIRADLEGDRDANIARFLYGLNREIRNMVEIHPYADLYDLVAMAAKVEKQQRRNVGRSFVAPQVAPRSEAPSTSNHRPAIMKPEAPKPAAKVEAPRDKPAGSSGSIQCFKCHGRGHMANQCPNRRALIMLENGEYVSDSKDEEHAKETSDSEVDESIEMQAPPGSLFVTRRILSVQPKEDLEQRENLFHTRCVVDGKLLSLVIDGGSCTNAISTIAVKKFGLSTMKHLKPYKLQWLNEDGSIKVARQTFLRFEIGGYKDEVLCDVVPMQATYVLLGRPWQVDRSTQHDGVSNKYLLMHKGKKVVLKPLSPKEFYEDQLQLQRNREQEKEASVVGQKKGETSVLEPKTLMLARSKDVKPTINESSPTQVDFVMGEALQQHQISSQGIINASSTPTPPNHAHEHGQNRLQCKSIHMQDYGEIIDHIDFVIWG